MAEAVTSVECGFCLSSDTKLVDPRCMPCGDSHCVNCLLANFETIGIVQCPTCSEVFDVEIDSLPSAKSVESCDICQRKGVRNVPAVVYCKPCAKKYCTKHLEHHDELNDDHDKMCVEEYRTRARQLAVVNCAKHKDQLYSLGCNVCFTVFCLHCVEGIDTCSNGASHKLLTLDNLVTALSERISELVLEVVNKEEKLSTLFKLASRTISDYRRSTEEMITALHQARDKQIEAIRAKYENLETELVTLRTKAQSEMNRFMEKDVGMKLSVLNGNRLKLEARLRQNHQVDVVRRFQDTKSEIERMKDEEIPSLRLYNSVSLVSKDESRDVEMQTTPANDAVINLESGLTTPDTLPKSATAMQRQAPNAVAPTQHHPHILMRRKQILAIVDPNTRNVVNKEAMSKDAASTPLSNPASYGKTTPGLHTTDPSLGANTQLAKTAQKQANPMDNVVQDGTNVGDVPMMSPQRDVVLRPVDNFGRSGDIERLAELSGKLELTLGLRTILDNLRPDYIYLSVLQILKLPVKTESDLNMVVNVVFERAVAEPTRCATYALLSQTLAKSLEVPMNSKQPENVSFRKLLLCHCQKEFEEIGGDVEEVMVAEQSVLEVASVADKTKPTEVLEVFACYRKLGIVRFIGELSKMGMLLPRYMHDCVVTLLKGDNEEKLEWLCTFLTITGRELDIEKAKPRMDQYFGEMKKIANSHCTIAVSSRIRLLIKDVIELRENRWQPRTEHNNSKTVEQVRTKAALEAHERQMRTSVPSHGSPSRDQLPRSGKESDPEYSDWQ